MAVVVAQLEERSLSIPEVRGSNPAISFEITTFTIAMMVVVYWTAYSPSTLNNPS